MTLRTPILRGQNFIRRAAVAERLVELAEPDPSTLCVDVGAGNGIITQACLSAGHRVLAVEIDDRLASNLHQRFGDNPRVWLVHDDLTTASLPDEPFSITANPPFNQSTTILRRWILDGQFQSAAIIAQHEFGRKIAGHFGATKMSVAVAPLALSRFRSWSPATCSARDRRFESASCGSGVRKHRTSLGCSDKTIGSS